MSANPGDTPPPNFIVFGEMGAGKSSLINLIAGEEVAGTSSGAKSCTLKSTEYTIKLPGSQCDVNLYDTAGLNEPTMNNTSYLDAIGNAHDLIVSLQKKGGVHGLLFCIRGGRISDTVQRNYTLFYEFLCQERVPITLIITGLENEPDDMDSWWTLNQAHVEKSGIASVAHVCITTIKGYNNVYEKRYVESRKKVHVLLTKLAREVACSVDTRGWFARICKKMQAFLAPGKGLVGKNHARMMHVLTKRCKLRKEDAEQLLRRMAEKEKD